MERNSINRWTRLRLDEMSEASSSIVQKDLNLDKYLKKENMTNYSFCRVSILKYS
jgi:hypothetical protein